MSWNVAGAEPDLEEAELRLRRALEVSFQHPFAAVRGNRRRPVVRVDVGLLNDTRMIRLVDAQTFTCDLCSCTYKAGPNFCDVVKHIFSNRHSSAVASKHIDLKRRMDRLRLIASLAGCIALCHNRAKERAYAPGGLGFKEAQMDFESHMMPCVCD